MCVRAYSVRFRMFPAIDFLLPLIDSRSNREQGPRAMSATRMVTLLVRVPASLRLGISNFKLLISFTPVQGRADLAQRSPRRHRALDAGTTAAADHG